MKISQVDGTIYPRFFDRFRKIDTFFANFIDHPIYYVPNSNRIDQKLLRDRYAYAGFLVTVRLEKVCNGLTSGQNNIVSLLSSLFWKDRQCFRHIMDDRQNVQNLKKTFDLHECRQVKPLTSNGLHDFQIIKIPYLWCHSPNNKRSFILIRFRNVF